MIFWPHGVIPSNHPVWHFASGRASRIAVLPGFHSGCLTAVIQLGLALVQPVRRVGCHDPFRGLIPNQNVKTCDGNLGFFGRTGRRRSTPGP